MTLMEKLRQLLGLKDGEVIDPNIKLDDLMKVASEMDYTEVKEEIAEEVVEKTEEIKAEAGATDDSTVEKKIEEEKVEVKKEEVTPVASEEKVETTETKVEAKETVGEIFEDGWFNSETGEIVEERIRDDKVREAIKLVRDRYETADRVEKINRAVDTELATNYSLAVKPETIKKMLDLKEVQVDKDGKVIGVKEAIETLRESEPGLFKDREKETNPLKEGFNPVVKKNNTTANNFSQAFRIMEEIN